MTDDESYGSVFRPVPPPEHIKAYRAENPDATWDRHLEFLLERFPQRDENGELNYIIVGSTAVKIHFPDRNNPPRDIDIIDLKGDLDRKIGKKLA